MNTVKAEIMQDILEKLEDWKNMEIDITNENPNEIAYNLWETENANESITCCAYESKEWIKKHFDDLDEIVENYYREVGNYLNPFGSPEGFQVIITNEVTSELIWNVWEENMNIDELITALKELQEEEDWTWYDRETYFS